MMVKLYLAILLLGIASGQCTENVPAIIFGDKTPTFLPSTLQRVTGDEFVTLVKSQADQDTLTVVFVENKLSVEDFHCMVDAKTCFGYLSRMDKTYLSSVERPVDSLIGAFEKKKSISVSSDDDLKRASLDGEKVLFVYLDDVEKPEDFQKHDELIHKLMQELQSKYGAVVAIYTGIHPSFEYSELLKRHARSAEPADEKPKEEPKSAEKKAHDEPKPAHEEPKAAAVNSNAKALNDEETPTHVFTNDRHVLLALKQMIIRNRSGGESVVVNADALTLSVTSEGNDSAKTEFVATLSGTGHKLEMTTSISAGTWRVGFRYNDNDEKKEKYHARSTVVGYGEQWSFGCGDLHVESFEHEVRLVGFQYQPTFNPSQDGNADERQFSKYVSDCVGYFSAGIWAALFVVFLMLSILTYGISMMLDIRTMDKFDDPKGKTITVSTTD